MQNIEYLVDEIKEKNVQRLQEEKYDQYTDVIAESKIMLINLKRFVIDSPIISSSWARKLFIICKILQWAGIVSAVIQLPILLAKFEDFKIYSESLSGHYSSILFADSVYLTYFLLSLCVIVIGFFGARFFKLQLHIESNRRLANDLVEELESHLKKIFI